MATILQSKYNVPNPLLYTALEQSNTKYKLAATSAYPPNLPATRRCRANLINGWNR